jgi:hypothetical protein
VRTTVARVLAVLFAFTWLVLPGFGLIDLSVSWDPDWPVVLEASWGVFMTVLVGGSFLAFAVRPGRAAPAGMTLLVALATLVGSAAAGLEPQLLGYAGLLAVEIVALFLVVPDRESCRPVWAPWLPLLGVAALGAVPWLLHADSMFRANRMDAGPAIGELTMGVDHHAVQGALAVALVTLAVLAACWPRGRRYLGVSVGLCAGYLGLVAFAFPLTWVGFGPLWSALCMAWGATIAALALAAPVLVSGAVRAGPTSTASAARPVRRGRSRT